MKWFKRERPGWRMKHEIILWKIATKLFPNKWYFWLSLRERQWKFPFNFCKNPTT